MHIPYENTKKFPTSTKKPDKKSNTEDNNR